jgi:hypothetical protein
MFIKSTVPLSFFKIEVSKSCGIFRKPKKTIEYVNIFNRPINVNTVTTLTIGESQSVKNNEGMYLVTIDTVHTITIHLTSGKNVLWQFKDYIDMYENYLRIINSETRQCTCDDKKE